MPHKYVFGFVSLNACRILIYWDAFGCIFHAGLTALASWLLCLGHSFSAISGAIGAIQKLANTVSASRWPTWGCALLALTVLHLNRFNCCRKTSKCLCASVCFSVSLCFLCRMNEWMNLAFRMWLSFRHCYGFGSEFLHNGAYEQRGWVMCSSHVAHTPHCAGK